MRARLMSLAAGLVVAGCFNPIQAPGTPAPDAGQTACRVQADCPSPVEGFVVDCVSGECVTRQACSVDGDCESVADLDICHPTGVACIQGRCEAKAIDPIWKGNPGACRTAADCGCQSLPVLDCEGGGFACEGGRCAYRCDEECASDAQCPQGMVCERVGDTPGAMKCVVGCHDDTQCASGETCAASDCPPCEGCACPGTCRPKGCDADAQCPAGSVCDFVGGGQKGCVPGCHEDSQCGVGQRCQIDACPECVGCPCVGQCAPVAGCATNADCPAGQVCGESPKCQRACVPGCRDSSECSAGELCVSPAMVCDGCGCANPRCEPAPGCKSDADCAATPGTVCEQDANGQSVCVPGCHLDSQCAAGEFCERVVCASAPCPGICRPRTPSCRVDTDCAAGSVCEPAAGGGFACVPGCHLDAQCKAGEFCERVTCVTSPCPGQCQPTTSACRTDGECGAGSVCEPVGDCTTKSQCVAGCHADAQCPKGQQCLLPRCLTCPCPGACVAVPAGCRSDAECASGTVCTGDATVPGKCVSGCHLDSQCQPGQRCQLPPCSGAACVGSCVSSPCLDADGDNYAAGCGGPVCDYLLGDCDCDDRDRAVHPGAAEVCGNRRDDDCDAQIDEGCTCPGGVPSCATDLDCKTGSSFCEKGCCLACPSYAQPVCPPNQCVYSGGIDENGCARPSFCAPCSACSVVQPVCGINYATYRSECEAKAIGIPVLHAGACVTGEGLGCGVPGDPACAAGTYCRDDCPMCAGGVLLGGRCTKIGACTGSFDCPAGLKPPACSTGGTWTCAPTHACLFSCP